MLRELHISNLAVIEDAAIELRPGLNCFTGQTGAGKSLVIGAFEILLGLRSATDMLRQGADEGRVSGVFEIKSPEVIKRINELSDAPGSQSDAPLDLLITRKLFASGRTSVSINGRPATAAMVRSLGELLVDVHGQHDHQFLLRPANQLLMLDRFAECEPLRGQFTELHRRIRELRDRRDELHASQTLRRQQLELYEFQAGEIDAAQPVEGEYDELAARHRLLSNLEKVHSEASAAHAALYDAEGAILERLQAVSSVLRTLTELDESLTGPATSVRDALAVLQDASFDLSRYIHRIDLDPAELAEVTDRLNTINRLIHKYGSGRGGTLDEVLAYRSKIELEIQRLRSETDDLTTIDNQIAPLTRELNKLGDQLTQKRTLAAAKLKPLIERQLADLGMPEARFDVSLDTPRKAGDGIAGSPLETPHDSSHGFDAIELLVQANPGQPARPLRKVASGGELSRVMLAIKSIVADADRICVLVFDEIDANVGGRMGTVIGSKLRALANGHQVLCITHLPQLAAHADHHLRIAKQTSAGNTRTTVTPLTTRDQRIEELAEMLTGKNPTDTTRKQVTEMLDTADPGIKTTKSRRRTVA